MPALAGTDTALAPPAPEPSRAYVWLLLLLALILLGAGIGLRDPWPSDEPRFALAAKQMVESGDWLFPHRGHELYSDKPPMLFWLQAIAYKLCGEWRVAFLLPSLLAGLLTLVLIYDLGRRLWNRRAGLYAMTALLFAFQFLYQVKRAQIDPLAMAWLTLANWGLLRHFLLGPDWRAYWIGCLAAGLGVVTKGVGVLAFLLFAPYLFARLRDWPGVARTERSLWRWLAGALAFAAPVLAWAVPVVLAARAHDTPEYAAYVEDLFFHQTAGRYAHSWDHAQPFWYYVPVVLLSWFPLSVALVAAAPRWWRDVRAGEARVMLPLAWAALLLVFFSVPSGKRDVYLMPALPMTALALAPYLASLVGTDWLRRAAYALTLLFGLLLMGVGLWALTSHAGFAERLVRERHLEDLDWILWVMLIAMGSAFVLSALVCLPRRGVRALLGGLAGLWLIWSVWSYPLLNDSNSAAGVMRRARELAGADTTIGLVAWKEQNLLMAQGPVREFGFVTPWEEQYTQAVQWLTEQPAKRAVFILEAAMGDCVDRNKAQHVGRANRRDWWLFRADAVLPGCVPRIRPEDQNEAG
jgi:4-amino-4-deoxy-L-arabinose transferase-like glycosyltransferase